MLGLCALFAVCDHAFVLFGKLRGSIAVAQAHPVRSMPQQCTALHYSATVAVSPNPRFAIPFAELTLAQQWRFFVEGNSFCDARKAFLIL